MKIPFFHRVGEGEMQGYGISIMRAVHTKWRITLIFPFWAKYGNYMDWISELRGMRTHCVSIRLRKRNLKAFRNPDGHKLIYARAGIFWKDLGPQKLVETEEARQDRLYLERTANELQTTI